MLIDLSDTDALKLRALLDAAPSPAAGRTPEKPQKIVGSGAAKVRVAGDSIVIHVDPPGKDFTPQSGSIVWADVTGNVSGSGGYYTADFYRPSVLMRNKSGGVTRAKLIPSANKFASGYVYNVQEIGASTHDLTHADNTNQKVYQAVIDGPETTDGKWVAKLTGNAFWWKDCA